MTDEQDEGEPWPDYIVARFRRLAADLRGLATFRPQQAARYEQEALRLERTADALDKELGSADPR